MGQILMIATSALMLAGCASGHDRLAANSCFETAGSTRLDSACAKAQNFGSANPATWDRTQP